MGFNGLIAGMALILIGFVLWNFGKGFQRTAVMMKDLTDPRNVKNRSRCAVAHKVLNVLGIACIAAGVVVAFCTTVLQIL